MLCFLGVSQACQRMVSLGPHLARCGGLKWNAKRCRLVTLLACDPALSSLDAVVHASLHAAEDAGAMDTEEGVEAASGDIAHADAPSAAGGSGIVEPSPVEPGDASGGAGGGAAAAAESVPAALSPIVDAGIVVGRGGAEADAPQAPVECLDSFVRATGQQEAVDTTRVRLQDEVLAHVLAVRLLCWLDFGGKRYSASYGTL